MRRARRVRRVDRLLPVDVQRPGSAGVLERATGRRARRRSGGRPRALAQDAPPYSGDYEVPVLKLYRTHLEAVLRNRRTAPRGAAPRYPGVIDAIAELAPEAASLRADWEAASAARAELEQAVAEADRVAWEVRGRRGAADQARLGAARGKLAAAEQEVGRARARLAQTAAALVGRTSLRDRSLGSLDRRQTDRAGVARDALAATSVALRLALEGLAVAPYAAKHAKKLRRPDLAARADRAAPTSSSSARCSTR